MNGMHESLGVIGRGISLVLFCTTVILSGCSGRKTGLEKKEAFLTYQQAVANEDFTMLKSVLSSEAVAEMDKSGIGLETAIKMVQAMSPPVVVVSEPLPTGEEDDLIVEGVGEGFENSKGTVSFVRENGELKIAKVAWEMNLNLADGGLVDGVPSRWDPDYEVNLGGWRALNGPKVDKIDPKYLKASNSVFHPSPKSFIKHSGYVPKPVKVIKHKDSDFAHLTFSPDGEYMATAGYGDYLVRTWDTRTWRQLSDQKMNDRPTSIAASPRGGLFVTGDTYSNLNFWPVQGGALDTPLKVNTDAGKRLAIAISDNAKLVATASWDQYLSIWSLEKRELLTRTKTKYRLRCIAFSPAGPVLAAGTTTNKFVLWDLRTGKGRVVTVPKIDKKSEVMSISFSPDGEYLVTGHNESSVTVWRVKDQKQLRDFYVPNASTMAVQFSPDGEVFATGHSNNQIYIWETKTAQRLAALKGHDGTIQNLVFSPDGTQLASASEDNSVIIWE